MVGRLTVKFRRAILCGLLSLYSLLLGAAPPDILLANVYREGIDVSRYLVSEKYDGVRAIWNGKQLVSRNGYPIAAPAWFTQPLPADVRLDGELWLGRGQFERLSGIVRRETPVDSDWRTVRYMVFELPGAAGDFAQRVRRIEALTRRIGASWVQAVGQNKVASAAELQQILAQVVQAGGEGLMLHRADALYESGRSDTLLKLKPWLDAEAVVIAHLPGKGKYQGQLGALLVRAPDGREFRLGTGFSDAQRREPPPLGSTVTYRYRELTGKGLPRFASFLRQRQE